MKSKIFIISFVLLALLSFVRLFGQTGPTRPKIWATKVDTCNLKNLFKLNDSIYRSEQPKKVKFACLGKIGIKSVLNLRSHHVDSRLIHDSSIKLYTVKMVANKITDNEVIESLRILKSGSKPIIVHCWHGSDRTGTIIAMYRIIFENWTKEQALDELQNGGYHFHKQYTNIPGYIREVVIDSIKSKVFN